MRRVVMIAIAVVMIGGWAACGGSGGGSGRPCSDDSSCNLGEVCAAGSCATGCNTARDCPGERPICDPASGAHGACVQCASAADCAADFDCLAGACRKTCVDDADCPDQRCEPAAKVCVDCTENGHCERGQLCLGNQCTAGCAADRDCPAATPHCDRDAGANGTCVQCLADGECPAGAPRCEGGACRATCATSADCALGVCDTAADVCVECLDKTHCSLGEVCDARACVAGCEVDLDCPAATPACDPAVGAHGSCYQCVDAGDCGSGQVCTNHACESSDPSLIDIPAGSFAMGSDADADTDNPVHTVSLSAFAIDAYEVTNALYAACVDALACALPANTVDYNDPTKAQHPVAFVAHAQASAYCAWAGKRLPTEAEWERAARGAQARIYPWGDQPPTCTIVNAGVRTGQQTCVGATSPVGSYPLGLSAIGAYDMAGNVREWVSDWYGVLGSAPATDPTGPASGSNKVARGGSFVSYASEITTATRPPRLPAQADQYIGFRCAKSRTAAAQIEYRPQR